MTYVIGCGGVGSWLVPALAKLFTAQELLLVDGDKLEEKNLDRQLFSFSDIGKYKAEALGRKYSTNFQNTYFGLGTFEHTPLDWLLCCADNHPARLSCLRACDMFGCRLIVAANETNSAEAYYYQPDWRDTALDPRVYYPEILSDRTGDPMIRGCTGAAQQQNRQLSSANFMAAALMQHLLVLWRIEVLRLDQSPEIIGNLPHQLSATLSRVGYRLIGETMKGQNK